MTPREVPMPATVKLSAIVDALDMIMEEWSTYLDKRTGEVHSLPDEAFQCVENAQDAEEEPSRAYADWEREDIDRARDILDNDDQYVALPDKFEIHEWAIMAEFSQRYPDDAISNELSRVIRGSGAFATSRTRSIAWGSSTNGIGSATRRSNKSPSIGAKPTV
ncbi:MAG: hypothetical protein NTW96_09360 [Planctomycetia bacterium]|nr:hypothetical protein [Planctomycetia bacterium]